MAEVVSAIAGHIASGRHGAPGPVAGIRLGEVTGRDLIQVGAWRETVDAVRLKLGVEIGADVAASPRMATVQRDMTVFLVAPEKFWVSAPRARAIGKRLGGLFPAVEAVVTELGHSRTVLSISGQRCRDLIARLMAIDTHRSVFPPGSFGSSGIHGVGCLLHYAADIDGAPEFDLYVPRSFALSMTEAIAVLAEQWGYEAAES